MNARARQLRAFLLARPCPDCGERIRPGEPLIVHVPGCRFTAWSRSRPEPTAAEES